MTDRSPMLDTVDREMLHALQSDGRISNKALAARIGLSPSACLARMRRLERDGVIERYGAIVSKNAVGAHIEAWATLTLERRSSEDRDALLNFLRAHEEVVVAYETAAPFDVLAHLVVRDFEAWSALEARLHAVVRLSDVRFCPIVATAKTACPWPLFANDAT